MKSKLLAITFICLFLFSCIDREKDLYIGPPPTADDTETGITQEDIDANVKNVFGVEFAADHDWRTAEAGVATLYVDPAQTQKVQVLVYTEGVNEENETVTSLQVLNETDVQGQSEIRLHYDAPKENLGLFAAFISDKSYELKRIFNGVASNTAKARTRAITTLYTLPSEEPRINVIEESYASQRGWNPGELLYGMSDYSKQKMTVDDYDDEYKTVFNAMVFSYFKNGRQYNNLPLVKSSGLYNDKIYPITTGDEPIIVSPVFKWDSGARYGDEVLNSDWYYYYFKEEDLGDDPVAYLESLPKYKAFPFRDCMKEDNLLKKQAAYALIYWGDGVPTEETVGSYFFPRGYKVGFMVRAKTTSEAPKKQGELYGDGRLNSHVNAWPNFSSSKLGDDGPRMAWLTVNNRLMLCCESGTDTDFNDIILEVEGGVEGFTVLPETERANYTYCFEDRELGDYDLNDLVIKAYRTGNQVTWSIVACGAYDELCVRNINAGNIRDDAEVHALFNRSVTSFINTDPGQAKLEPITATKNVAASFSFLDEANQPYIYNKTSGKIVRLAKAGEDPHAIMMAGEFLYPIERVCIKDAYPRFNIWGQNPVNSTNWYSFPETAKVYNK